MKNRVKKILFVVLAVSSMMGCGTTEKPVVEEPKVESEETILEEDS